MAKKLNAKRKINSICLFQSGNSHVLVCTSGWNATAQNSNASTSVDSARFPQHRVQSIFNSDLDWIRANVYKYCEKRITSLILCARHNIRLNAFYLVVKHASAVDASIVKYIYQRLDDDRTTAYWTNLTDCWFLGHSTKLSTLNAIWSQRRDERLTVNERDDSENMIKKIE